MARDIVKNLHDAIHSNDFRTVEQLLKLLGTEQCAHLSPEWHSSLHTAVLENRLSITRLLLKYGANVDYRNRMGRTPLHEAAFDGKLDIMELLLKHDADINARTSHGWTALILAVGGPNASVVGVSILLEAGADVNAQTFQQQQNDNGSWDPALSIWSALHAAAILPEPNIAHLLLRHGADPNATTKNRMTSLHLALRELSQVTAFLLYCFGALAREPSMSTDRLLNTDTPYDLYKKLPIHEAQFFQYLRIKRLPGALTFDLPSGPEQGPMVKELNVSNAMHLAVTSSSPAVIDFLISVYPEALEVLCEGRRSWHPLHSAARRNALESVEILLKNGAEVDARTFQGWTPLMLAAEQGHDEVIRTLIRYHADPRATSRKRKTGLSIAEAEKHLSTASLLGMEMHKGSSRHSNLDDIVSKLGRTSLSPSAAVSPSIRSVSSGPESDRDEDEDDESFSFFDAKDPALQESIRSPTNQPKNSYYVEGYLKDLERTWYEKIQWSPQDDKESSKHSTKPGPIKIAVLDTGIDLDHEDFKKPARRRTPIGSKSARAMPFPEKTQRERIVAFRNFSNASRPDDNVTDDDGHGTHVAGIILGIAPRAELYIAKIWSGKGSSEGSKAPQTKVIYDSVEAALLWAIESRVDIINMSFGFDRISQVYPSSEGLQDALWKANQANIIVLAAAANHANRNDIAWPARDGQSAICISSGNDGLDKSTFAPGSNSKVDAFLTHGEGISSHQSGGGFRQMSGTSVATPVAVGIVAMILALLNVTRTWSPEDKREHLMTRTQEKRVRSTTGMARVLRSVSRNSGGFFVLPRQVLWGTNRTAQDALRDIAREMGDI